MSRDRIVGNHGWPLIKVVVVIAVLCILAVAIGNVLSSNAKAREVSARVALGSLRSDITLFYANKAVTTGTANWPTRVQLNEYVQVMSKRIPKNPYQDADKAPDSICTGSVRGQLVPGGRGGWCYLESTGEIWPNTNVTGEKNW